MTSSPPFTILLVDDDRTFCKTLASALRRRGHETLVAHSVSEAIIEAQAWAPQAAVVDLKMPDESGLKFIEHLSLHHPQTKSVVLTGHGSIATAVTAVKLGAIQYLTKPVSVADIINALSGTSVAQDESSPSLDDVQWEHLQRTLKECEGNISEAARRLGLHRRTLQRKLSRGRGR